ncbi:MFS transporter [Nocardia sp. NPDC051750]|uniref:MFS transporter n=1 Tax=Nocardia sp. NPDC051750 TaxID=3364325 RepID=UPI00378F6B05
MTRSATPSVSRGRRATAAAFVGTAIEWYDFYIFGTAAALVLGQVFYPHAAPGAGLLASFATFWVGFLARPVGGMIFSHFGDRFGRRTTLITTLVMMGLATMCIGLLPGYAQIGVAAPILLVVLRAVQGLAVGGEWGGAVVLATENAEAGKRGLAGTWVQQGSPAGSILATLSFLGVGLLDDDSFLAWGWRIPFLASAVLVVFALIVRLKVEESQEFTNARAHNEVVKAPLAEVFRSSRRVVFAGIFAAVLGISIAYFTNTFLLAWTTEKFDIDRRLMLNVLLGVAVLQFVAQPLAARIAERVGARRVMIGGLLWVIVLAAPLFFAIQAGNVGLLAIMLALTTLGGSAYYALLATALANAFPVHVRYTGVSIAYQFCATIFGGSTPLIAQWVLNATGNAWAVMTVYLGIAAITVAGVWWLARLTPLPPQPKPDRTAAMSRPAFHAETTERQAPA